MAIAYTAEHGFQTSQDKQNEKIDKNEWLKEIPKLYTIIIPGADPFICDEESIEFLLNDLYGGHMEERYTRIDGVITFEWIDSIDDEITGCAVPTPLYLLKREIEVQV